MLMAIIENGVFKGACKSVGNVTLRKVNGRTIFSTKISRNYSNTPKQTACRSSFGTLARLGRLLKPVIDIGFDRVRNGSKCNNFTRSNSDLGNYLSQGAAEAKRPLPARLLYRALTDPAFCGQVFAVRGNISCKSEFAVEVDGQIGGSILLSRDFMPGDVLTAGAILITEFQGGELETTALTTYMLSPRDMAALENPRKFLAGRDNWPELNVEALRFFPGRIAGVIMTAIVTRYTERSTALFTATPIIA
jgi:hypothetical protein